jgi:hypothetical protein
MIQPYDHTSGISPTYVISRVVQGNNVFYNVTVGRFVGARHQATEFLKLGDAEALAKHLDNLAGFPRASRVLEV